MGKEEMTDCGDPRIFLDQYRFDLESWQEWNQSQRILGRFYTFVLALGQSEKKSLALPPVPSPVDFVSGLIHRIEDEQISIPPGGGWAYYLRPEERLIIDSHLCLPYIFPSVLKALDLAGLLSTDGLKNLALAALINKGGWINAAAAQDIRSGLPQGKFENAQVADEFLAFMADSLRESFGKTDVRLYEGPSARKILENLYDIFTTQESHVQQAVFSGLKKWFDPAAPLPSRRRVKWLYREGYIHEEPEVYLQRMALHREYNRLIYQGLKARIIYVGF